MRKGFLYLGVLLFIAGMVAAFASVSSLQAISPSGSSPTVGQLSLDAGALRGVPVVLNRSSVLLFSYNASAGVDFYLANQGAFAAMSADGANGISARSAATGLEGRGVYAIYENSSMAIFPYSGGSAAPAYSSNLTALPAGAYYAVFGNWGGVPAEVATSYTALGSSEFDSAAVSTLAYGGVSFLLMAAGFIMAVASLFMKGKNSPKQEMLDEEAQREYDLLEKKGPSGKGGKPKGPGRKGKSR